MPNRVLLVQLGKPGQLSKDALLARVRERASREMWGSSCTDRTALKRECFTVQRCGQTGGATRERVRFDATIHVVLVDGDTFAGILMGVMEAGALFVYNVCVESSRRGKGLAAQLFAWLGSAYGGPVTLGVYVPVPRLFRGNAMVLDEASTRFMALLRMYTRYGFKVEAIEGDSVRMRARALCHLPRLRGEAIV